MPKPETGETEDDFISRCMSSDEAQTDFPDEDQRFAVCSSMWAEKGYRKDMTSASDAIQYKALPLELKREPDNDGIFEGYASVFGVVDQGMDVVERGAFRKSLGSRKVKMLWQHDMSQPIGVWDTIQEDERGLFVRGRLLKEVDKGREAMALLRAGAIDSMSIGYRTMEAVAEGDGRVRKLTEIDLFEVSLVTFPMLPDAKITAVKAIQTERDFERFLRDAGYSRSQAVALTLHGFKALQRQRDAGDEEAVTEGASESVNALLQSLSKLKESLHVRGNQEGRRSG
jgi:HK97 family phage prohead protease